MLVPQVEEGKHKHAQLMTKTYLIKVSRGPCVSVSTAKNSKETYLAVI